MFHECQKKFEHPPNHVVYYSMNNFAGCIEGFATADRLRGLPKASSDLKSRNSERFDARLHGAGINDEENAGQRSKRGAPYGVSCGQERDMAYWSCRPQIIRHPTTLVTMATCALKRGCIPVPSFTLLLGAGTARLQTQAKASKAGGLMKLRHPASNLL